MKYLSHSKKFKPNKVTIPIKSSTKFTSQDPILTMDIFTLREKPINDASLDQLAMRMIKWVLTNEQIIIDDFLQLEGTDYKSLKQLRDRYPKLEKAYQYTKMCIGNKREKEGLYNKMNASMVMHSMPNYSQRWANLAEWRASLNTKEPNKPTVINVMLDNLVKKDDPDLKKVTESQVTESQDVSNTKK